MKKKKNQHKYFNNWYEEKSSAYLYQVMAAHETNILHKKLFTDLQSAAEKQAAIWSKRMEDTQLTLPTFHPTRRLRLVALLVQWFGVDSLHSILSAMKIRGMSLFTRFHSEHKHRALSSANNLRAAVFGVNDGLISNMSLLLGMVGANSSQSVIFIAGVAGLLAGACSMAAGEYISVRSQREVFEHQIAIEKQELEEYPEEEIEELKLIYEARGVPTKDAESLATLMINNPKTGLDTLAREELGLNPDELVSPIGAMVFSFFSFAVGAFIPLLPFILSHYAANIYISVSLTAIALFIVGAILSLFSNRNAILLGFRMLGIGAIAGGLTFIIGRIFGIAM